MLRCYRYLSFLICLTILLPALCAYSEEEIEDLIDIFEAHGKIIAIIGGQKTVTYSLGPKEKVLWSDSSGKLGAFLTNDHFLVISTTSGAWHELPLGIDESEKTAASLSPNIALLATVNRAIAFDAGSNRFIETQLPIRDELHTAKAAKYIAMVITSSRAFGLALETSAFTEIRFGVREIIETLKMTSSKATIRTSDRLLTFEATGSIWKEHRF